MERGGLVAVGGLEHGEMIAVGGLETWRGGSSEGWMGRWRRLDSFLVEVDVCAALGRVTRVTSDREIREVW